MVHTHVFFKPCSATLLFILEQVFSIFTIWISWEFFKCLSSDITLFNNFISLFRTLLQAVSSNQATPSKLCLAISDKTSNFLIYKVYLPQTLEYSSTKSFASLWGGSPFLHCPITWFSFTSWPSPELPLPSIPSCLSQFYQTQSIIQL